MSTNTAKPKARPKTAKSVPGPAAVGRPPHAPGTAPPTAGVAMALPHERDESTSHVAGQPDPVIQQAKSDLDAGLVDTDMRATAGLDAKRRAELVPGAGGKPPQR